VAWGTALPRLATCLVLGPLHARRHIGIPLSAYWREVVLRPSLAMLPFALTTWVVELLWPAADLARYFAQVLATLPLAGLGVWVVALRPEERGIALAAVGRALGTRWTDAPSPSADTTLERNASTGAGGGESP
jgi:hypothetical protein